MFDPKNTTDFFETSARVLLRCWLFGFVLLFVWLGAVLFAGNIINPPQTEIFGLSEHELNVISYCGIGFFKLLVLMFFFIPWLAVKLVLRRGKP